MDYFPDYSSTVKTYHQHQIILHCLFFTDEGNCCIKKKREGLNPPPNLPLIIKKPSFVKKT